MTVLTVFQLYRSIIQSQQLTVFTVHTHEGVQLYSWQYRKEEREG